MATVLFPQGLTREAREYAVKELARRSGVSREFFATWKLEVESDQTVVTLSPEANTKVLFPHARAETLRNIAAGSFPFAEASWPRLLENDLLQQPLCVPFVVQRHERALPLFLRREEGPFLCSHDLLLSLLCTLSRVEEMVPGARDEHGRFLA